MNYTCRHCGKPIFWFENALPARWVHGINEDNWEYTNCGKSAELRTSASPAYFKEYLKLIKS